MKNRSLQHLVLYFMHGIPTSEVEEVALSLKDSSIQEDETKIRLVGTKPNPVGVPMEGLSLSPKKVGQRMNYATQRPETDSLLIVPEKSPDKSESPDHPCRDFEEAMNKINSYAVEAH